MKGSVVTVTKVRGFIALLLSMALVITTMGTALAAPNGDKGHKGGVKTEQVHDALRGIDGVLDDSKGSKAKAKGQSMVLENADGISAEVPLDAKKGVKIGVGDNALKVKVPNANEAGKGKVVSEGTVAYPSGEQSANAVQLLGKNGEQAVRMLTVIKSSDAATQYPYEVDVPAGGKIEILPNGGAMVLDGADTVIAVVDVPWAKDANGLPLATHFTTDGTTLVQHVEHNVPGVAYPVVADPIWFYIAPWVLRRCGIGYFGGATGAWITGANAWQIFGAGVFGCIFSFVR